VVLVLHYDLMLVGSRNGIVRVGEGGLVAGVGVDYRTGRVERSLGLDRGEDNWPDIKGL
jgi:hypothetical protein